MCLVLLERGPKRLPPEAASEPRYIPPLPGQMELRADYGGQPEVHVPLRARDVCIPPAHRTPKDFRFRRHREGRKPETIRKIRLSRRERYELWVIEFQAPILRIVRSPRLVLADCEQIPGPCEHVACKYHLKLDVNPETGAIKDNWPGLDPDEMPETCAMRVANGALKLGGEGGETPTATIAKLFNLTDERLRQLEHQGRAKVRQAIESQPFLERE
jgi:hypothetical protein